MKTIALVSQKGGAGKTTLAIHIAVAAHQAGLHAAIADLDPQSSAWKWSERRKANGIEHPEAATATAEQLPALQRQAEAGGLDLLVIDSAPMADRPALLACRAADLVLIPCRASILDIDAIGASHDLAVMAKKPSYVILNSCNTATGFDTDEAQAGMQDRGIETYPGRVYQRVAYQRGFIPGSSATEIEPGGKAAAEIGDLFAWIVTELRIELPAREIVEAA